MPRKFKVEITETAEKDVAEIWEYIAQDKPDAETAFIIRLEEQIGTLEHFPQRCPLVPENEWLGAAYRHLLYGNYRTIFKIVRLSSNYFIFFICEKVVKSLDKQQSISS